MSRIASIQMTSGPEVAGNLAAAGRLLEEAVGQGAVLAGLPENFAIMGRSEADKLAVSEPDGEGPIQEFLAATARRLKLWIIGGTIPVRAGADGRVAAASLVYDAEGKRRARYDKIHLFDVKVPDKAEEYRESATIVHGREPVVLDTPAGKLGLAVCYDVRFPELFRKMSAAGAEIFSLPSAFTAPTGRAHWETLLRARAIENLCYLMAPAQAGMHANGRETYGDTMIVDYWGRVLSRLPRGAGVVTAPVERERQMDVRRSFPALDHRIFKN
ncbi:MAG TPA: carbon-nitrogen hydrolase family protein [Steroidobacteraceae bacterium]|jgi:nitrilase|nr:carbon-nitrogen hydrolase family protein [Steroidobacteraceae bacterium]